MRKHVHGTIGRIVSPMPPSDRGRKQRPDGGSAPEPQTEVPPLEWMKDSSVPGDTWGPDAAASPLTYWHRRELERLAGDGRVDRLIPEGPILSVVVPLGQAPPDHVDQCVRSVLSQTYPAWELLLGSDESGGHLRGIVQRLVASDSRVSAASAPRGKSGVSSVINHALESVTGQFVVRLEPEDMIDPGALAAIAAVLAVDEQIDVLYSDEDRFTEIEWPVQPYFKPDWDPDLLLSSAYLGHALVIRTELLRSIGGYRPEFDGGEEFDVMLRATEQARRVAHVPRVLYHSRIETFAGSHRITTSESEFSSRPLRGGASTDGWSKGHLLEPIICAGMCPGR